MIVTYDRLHLDLEAVAFKRQSQEMWAIFFDFEQYGLTKLAKRPKGVWHENFSIEIEELYYNYGVKKLEQWVI